MFLLFQVKRANDIANAVVVDAEHLLSSSPVRVENCMKAPRFVEGEVRGGTAVFPIDAAEARLMMFFLLFFENDFGDGNWCQAEAWSLLLELEVDAFTQ